MARPLTYASPLPPHKVVWRLGQDIDTRRWDPWRSLRPLRGQGRWVAGIEGEQRIRLWVERAYFPNAWHPVLDVTVGQEGGQTVLRGTWRASRTLHATTALVIVVVNAMFWRDAGLSAIRDGAASELGMLAAVIAFFLGFVWLVHLPFRIKDQRVVRAFLNAHLEELPPWSFVHGMRNVAQIAALAGGDGRTVEVVTVALVVWGASAGGQVLRQLGAPLRDRAILGGIVGGVNLACAGLDCYQRARVQATSGRPPRAGAVHGGGGGMVHQ